MQFLWILEHYYKKGSYKKECSAITVNPVAEKNEKIVRGDYGVDNGVDLEKHSWKKIFLNGVDLEKHSWKKIF